MRILSLFVVLLSLWNVCLGGQFISYPYGGRNNMLYVPSASGSNPLPLFVMLHGCTQNPTDFATGTKMNTYAEQYGFFVVYPEQPSSANMNKCWNWFEPAHQSRGAGEPALIVSIAQSLSSKYQIDSSMIFAGGLSAGAAMTVILGATYPDVFRGLTVGAGLEYKAATSMTSAFTAMTNGGPNPTTQGGVAYSAMGKYAQTLLVLVVHGTADYTVYPVNGKQVVSQYARTLDLVLGAGTAHGYITDTPTTTTNGQVPGGRAYTTYTYESSKTGETFIQYITVTGMGHAWSGGSSSGSYTDPQGPDASLLMVNYFLNSTNSNSTTSTSSSSSSSSSSSISTSSSSSTTGSATTGGSTTGGGSGYVFTSIGGEDGYVGKTPLDGFSTTICQIGGKGGLAQTVDDYRTILSFDTSALSPGNYTSAVLTITRQSLNGATNPLIVDIKQGTFELVPSSTTLTQLAYYGVASASNIGSIAIPSSDGASTSFQLPSSALQYLTGGIRTQIMLRQNAQLTPYSPTPTIVQIYDGQATLTVN